MTLTIDAEMARLAKRFAGEGYALPAPGIKTGPMPDLILGNADIEASSTWAPPQHEPERVAQCYPLKPEIER